MPAEASHFCSIIDAFLTAAFEAHGGPIWGRLETIDIRLRPTD